MPIQDTRPQETDSFEADKVLCGQRHFEALGVDFAIAVGADEV
jgi:hypothetical protein